MTTKLTNITNDPDWGCSYSNVDFCETDLKVKACHVYVTDIQKIAAALTTLVLDSSWMTNLDKGTQRSYKKTAEDTANELVKIFTLVSNTSGVGADFGELLVSMSSARALETMFSHLKLPIAEIWKPQIKQNEGFDFHTICQKSFLNFGEAKFSSSQNAHGKALDQARDFINDEKHFRDRVHLKSLAPKTAIDNLDNEQFGIVAAFSVNSENKPLIYDNALKTALSKFPENNIEFVYLIGVQHANT